MIKIENWPHWAAYPHTHAHTCMHIAIWTRRIWNFGKTKENCLLYKTNLPAANTRNVQNWISFVLAKLIRAFGSMMMMLMTMSMSMSLYLTHQRTNSVAFSHIFMNVGRHISVWLVKLHPSHRLFLLVQTVKGGKFEEQMYFEYILSIRFCRLQNCVNINFTINLTHFNAF